MPATQIPGQLDVAYAMLFRKLTDDLYELTREPLNQLQYSTPEPLSEATIRAMIADLDSILSNAKQTVRLISEQRQQTRQMYTTAAYEGLESFYQAQGWVWGANEESAGKNREALLDSLRDAMQEATPHHVLFSTEEREALRSLLDKIADDPERVNLADDTKKALDRARLAL